MLRRLVLIALLLVPLEAAAQSLRFGQGLLWVVEKDGQPAGHVFGTFHSADPDVLAVPPPVTAALAASRVLVVEVVLTAEGVRSFASATTLRRGQYLDDLVTPDLFQRVLAAGERRGLHVGQINRLKPWAAALIVTRPSGAQTRQARDPVLDDWLVQQARAHNKPVYSLELAAEQAAVFDGLPIDHQIAILRAAVDKRAHAKGPMAEIKALYLRQDVEGILTLAKRETTARDLMLSQMLDERLFTIRNRRMAARALKYFERGGAFIAVGAGHLPGEEGVLALLEQRGYRVARAY
jgi:hypothetical protein